MTGRETRPLRYVSTRFLRLPLRGSCRKATEGVFDTLLPPRCGPPSSKRKAKKHFHKPITKASFAFWQCPLTQLSKALHIIPNNQGFFCLFGKPCLRSYRKICISSPITEVSFAYFSFQRKVGQRRGRAWLKSDISLAFIASPSVRKRATRASVRVRTSSYVSSSIMPSKRAEESSSSSKT